MLGRVVYKNYAYAVQISTRFGGFRMYLKPENCESAMYAENITTDPQLASTEEWTAAGSLLEAFEEDYSNCRYRLDAESGLKLSTTMDNKSLASRIAVAIQAVNTLAHKAHVRESLGEFRSVWSQTVQQDSVSGTVTFKLGFMSSGVVDAGDLHIYYYEDGIDNDAISANTFQMTPQMCIIKRECEKYAVFKALKDEAKRMFSLRRQFSQYNEELYNAKKSRTGYYSVKLSGADTQYPGAEYLKSTVVKSMVNLGTYATIDEVREAHPDKNTMWIEDCEYHIVTEDMLQEVLKELWEAEYVSFDTETTGLKINFKSRDGLADELVGVCLSCKAGTGYYFPLQHKLFENLCNGDHRYFMAKYMKSLLENKKIICHNLSFDWKVGYIYEINVNCVFDTILAFGVTMRYEHLDFPLGLKDLCSLLFGFDMFEIEDFVIADWKNTTITFADLPRDLVEHYGPADADITLRLFEHCIKTGLLKKYGAQRVFDLEVNFAKAVAYSEFWGYHMDVEQLPVLEQEIVEGMERESKILFEMAGREFNPNSTPQLTKIIYEELYPDIVSSGIVQKPTTKKEILHELDEIQDMDGNPMYPFVRHLIEYRRYEVVYKNFFKKKDIFVSEDGFVFPGVQQLGTNTGRISVKDPNYQSYNDVVKKRVVGREGFYIFDCDFAQIEYRVLASMAGQDALISAFDDPDLDYHTHQAARMFSIPYAAVSKQLRQQSKGINFGLPYGMGDESLGARVYGARTPENTAKAADLRKRFFAGQEKIQEFFERVRSQGVKLGYTETWLGRRRYYHRDVFSVNSIRRQAGNHVIQGTAADIWKMAVTRLFNRLVKEDLLGKVLLNCFIHDELMGEVSVDLNPYDFIKMWREEYELALDKFCRLYAGFGWGNSWYEAKKADYPPQFIDTLVNKEDRSWDGDYKKLIIDTKNALYDFETKRVVDWLQEVPEGTLLAPHIGGYLYSKVGDWWDELKQKVPECNEFVLKKKEPTDKVASLDQVIEWFCLHENIEYKPNWILPPDTQVSTPAQGTQVEDTEADEAAAVMNMLCQQVYNLGFYLDTLNSLLYLKCDNMQVINAFMQAVCVPIEEADIGLVLLVFDAQGACTAYQQAYGVKFDNFNAVQESIHIMYSNKGVQNVAG